MSETIIVNLNSKSYAVEIKAEAILNLYKYTDVSRHAFIVTDSNVEKLYLQTVKEQFVSSDSFTIKPGENSKSFNYLEKILAKMQTLKLNRNIIVIGLGGGVVGDLAGLVAALYLRGVDYLAIPTTTLAQIDSSVGGKVAINLNGVKNVVGSFYQPTKVIIDPNVLLTLSNKEYNSGLVEAVKMGLLFDPTLFEIFLQENIKSHIIEIIKRSIINKSELVSLDEKDLKERKLLNFGHTLGHALETKYGFSHGQSVMLGMIYTVDNLDIKQKLIEIAQKFDLYYQLELTEDLYDLMILDKKMHDNYIELVQVDEIGKGYLKKYPKEYLWEILNGKWDWKNI